MSVRSLSASVATCMFAAMLITSLATSADAQQRRQGSATAETSQSQQPYARRDYQLGITLTQFRNIPHPDQADWPGAFPVCSNEARASSLDYLDARIDGQFARIGVIKCVFFYRSTISVRPTIEAAGLKLLDIGSRTSFYFFQPSGEGEPRLFRIETGGPTEAFERVVDGFRSNLGNPSSRRDEPIQNRAGATFTNTVVIWRNAVSSIQVSRYGETLRVFEVVHTYEPTQRHVAERLNAIDRDNSRRM